jgi:hypothetical protein
MLAEEILRDLQMDAGAVAGLAVGIDRAAVPDRLQRRDAGQHDLAPRLAVDRGDQADAAGIVLGRRDRFSRGIVARALPGRCPGRYGSSCDGLPNGRERHSRARPRRALIAR